MPSICHLYAIYTPSIHHPYDICKPLKMRRKSPQRAHIKNAFSASTEAETWIGNLEQRASEKEGKLPQRAQKLNPLAQEIDARGRNRDGSSVVFFTTAMESNSRKQWIAVGCNGACQMKKRMREQETEKTSE